jgi:CO/xanthine dehydrogenase FAD-binding subunit
MPKAKPPKTLSALARSLARHGRRALVVADLDGVVTKSYNRVLIDASAIPEFATIRARGNNCYIGTGATLGAILRLADGENGLLKQAVSMTANPLVRNRVNLLSALDPESEHFDVATALVVLRSKVRVQSMIRSRLMSIDEFLLAAASGLKAGEFPAAVEFSKLGLEWQVGFFRVNPGRGKPTVSAAVRLKRRRNVVIDPEIVVSSSTIIPVRAPVASKALDRQALTFKNVKRVAEVAAVEMLEVAGLREDPYESSLVEVAVSRAISRVNEILSIS